MMGAEWQDSASLRSILGQRARSEVPARGGGFHQGP